jgi:hypothetical protein
MVVTSCDEGGTYQMLLVALIEAEKQLDPTAHELTVAAMCGYLKRNALIVPAIAGCFK